MKDDDESEGYEGQRRSGRWMSDTLGDLFDDDFLEGFFFGRFGDIRERLARMQSEMDDILGRGERQGVGRLFEPDPWEREVGLGGSGGEVIRRGPYVYGYSVHVGPDGIPHVEEFGNCRPMRESLPRDPSIAPPGDEAAQSRGEDGAVKACAPCGPGLSRDETPMYEISDCGDHLLLVAELPGVEKKDVDLRLDGRVLRMDARGAQKGYTLTLELPRDGRIDRRRMHCRNGVLEVKIMTGGGNAGGKTQEGEACREGERAGEVGGAKVESSFGSCQRTKIKIN